MRSRDQDSERRTNETCSQAFNAPEAAMTMYRRAIDPSAG
jgi:hypothetical protein